MRRRKNDPARHALEAELNHILDQVFDRAAEAGWNVPTLAEKADVSRTAVYSLFHYSSRYPRFATICLLARAVNLRIVSVETRAHQQRRAS